ncbi:MAG: ABC transporter ATP-binding protein [Candidatus Heimdallarchaeota archaeon]
MSQQNVIEIMGLKKTREDDEILAGISFNVQKGEIFALLGSDGSGKSSTMEILVGLQKPTEGDATVLGYDIKSKIKMREIKKLIGVLPQEFRTHDNLTVKENILFWGKMYDKMIEINELLALLQLDNVKGEQYKKLPLNVKRRVGLAIAFVNDPEIVFLDEPSAGLDQFSKKEVWEILKAFNKQGKTIFLTTNDALEPQAIANRVAIIHRGLIKDIGTPMELIDRFSTGNKVIVRCPNEEVKALAIETLQSVCPIEIIDDDIVISSEEITLLEILGKLDKADVRYSDIVTKRPTLNDVFITLTGETLSKR